ncbi:MAG: hypothetical protein WC889_15865, partial [Myxococcota bacterium]
IKVDYKFEISPLKPGTTVGKPEVVPEPRRSRIEKDPLGKLEGKSGEGQKGGAGAAGSDGKKDSEEDSEGSP